MWVNSIFFKTALFLARCAPYNSRYCCQQLGVLKELYNTSGRLLLNLCIMSHRGNHLSVLYDKIPVLYALKYPKFTTITFYPSAWGSNSLLTSSSCTISSWPHAHFKYIFTHVTITTKILGTNIKYVVSHNTKFKKKIDVLFKTLF